MHISWPSFSMPKVSLPGKDRLMQETLEAYHAASERMSSFDRFTPSQAAKASQGQHLRAMTYNVELGGKDYPGILATIQKANPDVAGLQEVSRSNAEKLARDLGMYVAFYGDRKAPFQEPVGKAILSKYPLETAHHDLLGKSSDHWEAIRRFADNSGKSVLDSILHTELGERRGVIETTFTASGKKFAMLDTHLTLRDAKLNGQQIAELQKHAEQLEKQGYEVLMVGDFNSNLALKNGPSTPGKAFGDPTDTVAEWKERYGQPGAGNIGDASDMRAADGLRGELKSAWETSDQHYSVTTADAQLTPKRRARSSPRARSRRARTSGRCSRPPPMASRTWGPPSGSTTSWSRRTCASPRPTSTWSPGPRTTRPSSPIWRGNARRIDSGSRLSPG